jgi:hypothetical protein
MLCVVDDDVVCEPFAVPDEVLVKQDVGSGANTVRRAKGKLQTGGSNPRQCPGRALGLGMGAHALFFFAFPTAASSLPTAGTVPRTPQIMDVTYIPGRENRALAAAAAAAAAGAAGGSGGGGGGPGGNGGGSGSGGVGSALSMKRAGFSSLAGGSVSFEDPRWWQSLPSLKPVGLCAVVAADRAAMAPAPFAPAAAPAPAPAPVPAMPPVLAPSGGGGPLPSGPSPSGPSPSATPFPLSAAPTVATAAATGAPVSAGAPLVRRPSGGRALLASAAAAAAAAAEAAPLLPSFLPPTTATTANTATGAPAAAAPSSTSGVSSARHALTWLDQCLAGLVSHVRSFPPLEDG